MTGPTPENDPFRLLSAWCDGSISEAEVEQLDERLRTDPEFRKFYLAYVDIHAILTAHVRPIGDLTPGDPPLQSVEDEHDLDPPGRATEAVPRQEVGPDAFRLPRRGPNHWGWWAAAAVVVLGLTMRLWPRSPQAVKAAFQPSLPMASATVLDSLAMVTRLEGVRWEPEDGPPPAEGAVLKPRRLRLHSGLATLTFFNGVTLTLEGTVDLDLVSLDRVFCRHGKLRARVPKGAEGFVVASLDSAVIDKGTEFGLNVGADGKSRVRVFEGRAEAALLDDGGAPNRMQIIEQSKEFTLDPHARQIADSGARPAEFANAPDLARSSLLLDPGYAGAVLRSRPRGYWRFESLSGGVFPNEVPGGPPLRVNGPVALGRAGGGNGYAVFKADAPGQFLTTDSLWELAREPGHAVELWCLSESFKHATLAGLYPAREFNEPSSPTQDLHTFLVELTGKGRLELHKPGSVRLIHRWPLDLKVVDTLFSETYYFPHHWHHVVAQKKGDRMELYFDGAADRTMQIAPDYPTLPCRLVVGRRTTDATNPSDRRSFVGQLDELAVYDHTLSAEEIRTHFRLASQEARPG